MVGQSAMPRARLGAWWAALKKSPGPGTEVGGWPLQHGSATAAATGSAAF